MTNKDEEMVREWKWPQDGKLAQPVVAQVVFIGLLYFSYSCSYNFFFLPPHVLVSLKCLNCEEHDAYRSSTHSLQ